jgi:hypothetical protein
VQYPGILLLSIGFAVCGCGPLGGDGADQGAVVVEPTSLYSEVVTFEPRDTLITDTVITDEGYMLLKHRFSWFSSIDSINILIEGRLVRSQLLNPGGYMAAHTSLNWTNDRFVCFRFGCGSPCWGEQYIDLKEVGMMVEVMLPIWSDSTRSLVIYPDTSYSCCGLILENLNNGQRTNVKVDTIRAVVSALAFDSIWVKGDVLHLKRSDYANREERIDLTRVQ